ncbi:MAG: hypothetical protein SGILL_000946 [Bacillariaceae sp.]
MGTRDEGIVGSVPSDEPDNTIKSDASTESRPPLPSTPAGTPTATSSETSRKSVPKRNVSSKLASRLAKFGAEPPKPGSLQSSKSHLNVSNHSLASVSSAISLSSQDTRSPNGSPMKQMRKRPPSDKGEVPGSMSVSSSHGSCDGSLSNHQDLEPSYSVVTPGGSRATPLSARKRNVVATKISGRVSKFDANPLDGALFSPMQLDVSAPNISITGPPLSIGDANDKETDLSPMHLPRPVPSKKRSVRHKKIEVKAQMFDSPAPASEAAVKRVLLSPQEVKELIKSSNTNHRLDQLLYRYEHLSQEESKERRRLAAKISAKERRRRLGTSSANCEARKIAWEESRTRFQEAALGKNDTTDINQVLYGPRPDGSNEKEFNVDVFDEVRGISYNFSDFVPPTHAKTEMQRQLILEAMEQEFPFAEFRHGGKARTEGSTDALVAAFESVFFPMSDVLLHQDVKQGNDAFFILESGTIDLQKDGVSVRQLKNDGDTFGQLALMHHAPSNVTVSVASSSAIQGTMAGAQLLKIDQKTYRGLLHAYSEKAKSEKQDALSRVKFLHALVEGDDKLCARLCSIMVRQEFKPHDIFDAPEDSIFFIIQSGTVRVTSNDNTLDEELTCGSFFGEKSLIESFPNRVAASSETSLAALSKGVLFSIDKHAMEQILGRGRLEKIKDMRKLASTALVKKAKLTRALRNRMTNNITARKLNGGDTNKWKVEKNQRPALYVVRTGSVVVSYDDEETGSERQDEVKAGEIFGHEQVKAVASPSGTKYRRTGGLTTTTLAGQEASIGILPLEEARSEGFGPSQSPLASEKAAIQTSSLSTPKRIHQGSEALQLRQKIRDAVQGSLAFDQLERIRLLGEGEYGEVWMVAADVFQTGVPELRQKFALKSQSRMDITRGKDASADILREIKILTELDHPQVVNLINTYEDEESIHILMDLIPGGELWDFIHREDDQGNWKSGIAEEHAKFVTMVVADSLDFIHSKGIVFRDLKPENIMIDADGYPVLVDFGFSKICPDKTYTFVGTPNYVCPEIITNAGHNRSADFWALGVTVYETMTGENPFFFDGMDQASLYLAICEENFYPLPEGTSDTLRDFVERLLKKKSTERLGMLAGGAHDVFEHPWLNGLDLERIRRKEWPSPWKAQQDDSSVIEEGVLQKLGMSIAAPSLDDSINLHDVQKDEVSISFRDSSERDNSIGSIREEGELSVHSVQEVQSELESQKKVEKKKKKAKKKKMTTESPRKKTNNGDVTSQYQFVTPTRETYYNIKTPSRSKSVKDKEASNNRRSALKGKLRNLGIDSDEDLDGFDFLSKKK